MNFSLYTARARHNERTVGISSMWSMFETVVDCDCDAYDTQFKLKFCVWKKKKEEMRTAITRSASACHSLHTNPFEIWLRKIKYFYSDFIRNATNWTELIACETKTEAKKNDERQLENSPRVRISIYLRFSCSVRFSSATSISFNNMSSDSQCRIWLRHAHVFPPINDIWKWATNVWVESLSEKTHTHKRAKSQTHQMTFIREFVSLTSVHTCSMRRTYKQSRRL